MEVTNGYKAVRFAPCHCKWCASAKARSFGLRHKGRSSDVPEDAEAAGLVMPVTSNHGVHSEDTSDDNGSDAEGDLDHVQYTADTAGKQLGTQSVPRFDLTKLRLWEVMFVDNKDYPCQVRGGARQALLFICCKSRLKMVLDVNSKKRNGAAFSRIVAHNGIHKVEYPCRVYSDGCGSMAHVVTAAVRAGIDHAYIPPHQQSLNEAEKVAGRVWESARAHMECSGAPDSVFGLGVQYVCYVDARMATTASRGFKTPYQIGERPGPRCVSTAPFLDSVLGYCA